MCALKQGKKKQEKLSGKLLLHIGIVILYFMMVSMGFYIQLSIGSPESRVQLRHLCQDYAFLKTIKAPFEVISAETNRTYKYFLYNSKCHMQYLDPLEEDALNIYNPMQYEKCANDEDFIKVVYDEEQERHELQIVKEINGTEVRIECCYKEILRAGGKGADDKIQLDKCHYFNETFVVPKFIEWMLVDCEQLGRNGVKQSYALAFVHKINKGFIKPKSIKSEHKPRPSILILGIDSLSRSNFRRNMPLTFEYMRKNQWFELEGYNKMADNTYPNLMALLTGYNEKQAYDICLPKTPGGLDTCSFIWDLYERHGYQTAFGEDFTVLATFNYLKQGFLKPPTDHYLRPLIVAASEKLPKDKRPNHFCVGRKHLAEYIYDYAEQFATVYKDSLSFGFFWVNSFSHDEFDASASMDEATRNYLMGLESEGIMESSIIIFLSDHGMRFGRLRNLRSGFLEERLPVFQIFLPKWFQLAHPDYVAALTLNSRRLTSPYDVYSTFQHILNIEDGNSYPKPMGCPTCQSIFLPIPENRSCEDAGISDHWCTCHSYLDVPLNDTTIVEIVEQTLLKINHFMAENSLQPPCPDLHLRSIKEAQRKENLDHNSSVIYRIKFDAKPNKPLFETTVVHNLTTNEFIIDVNSISRINTYKGIAKCINHKKAKSFCICP